VVIDVALVLIVLEVVRIVVEPENEIMKQFGNSDQSKRVLLIVDGPSSTVVESSV